MEAATWGFIGTIIGALASIATTAIGSWNSNNLSNKAKRHEREEIANAFQRETILELQVELLEYFRSCSQIYRHEKIHFEKTGEWGGSIPDRLNSHNRDLNAKTAILIQRIAKDELRAKLQSLKSNCTKCLLAKDQYAAGAHHASSSEEYNEASELLGKTLRATYWQPNA